MSKLNKVYIAGCFDLFHPGHLHLIQEAQQYGNELIVAVVTDKAMRKYKNENRPIISENERIDNISKIKGVHRTFLCNEDPHGISVLEKVKPDTIIMGYESDEGEQKEKIQKLIKHFPNIEIIIVPKKNPEKYSTTEILNKIK